jgi:hypothetical protein
MRIQRLTLPAFTASSLTVSHGEEILSSTQEEQAGQIQFSFAQPVILQAGDTLTIRGNG